MSAAFLLEAGECRDDFTSALASAEQRVLILDYDGTLAPFHSDRFRAYPYPPVPHLLKSIMKTCATRVVIVTSRPAQEVPRLLGMQSSEHPEIWGSYGMERLSCDGSYDVTPLDPKTEDALECAAAWAESQGLRALIEKKRCAVAIHWRELAPEIVQQVRQDAYLSFAPLACRMKLLLWEFDGGIELRSPTFDKAHVVRSILAETPVNVPIAYLGDDVSDEEAFRALDGRGMPILVRDQFRSTHAKRWLKPPEQLVRFFYSWLGACGGSV
jgi:trehalose 6-phosphate phosphatase